LEIYVNREIQEFIEKGISDNAEKRYKTVDELQDAFNKMMGIFKEL
jgi:hypothetical protein